MKILLFGSQGMVGSSVVRILSTNQNFEIIKSNRDKNNLFDFQSTQRLIEETNPDYIINAARVGGIHANNENGLNL